MIVLGVLDVLLRGPCQDLLEQGVRQRSQPLEICFPVLLIAYAVPLGRWALSQPWGWEAASVKRCVTLLNSWVADTVGTSCKLSVGLIQQLEKSLPSLGRQVRLLATWLLLYSLFSFGLGDYTQWCSEATTSSLLGNCFWLKVGIIGSSVWGLKDAVCCSGLMMLGITWHFQ